MPILKVRGLSKSFGGLWAVSNVDLDVFSKSIVGLIGPNGSGKSTLFNLINGLLKPSSGSIYYNGEDITGKKVYKLCHMGIARTFQIVKPFTEMTVLKNVMVARAYGGKAAKGMNQIELESDELLNLVGLDGKQKMISNKLGLVDRKKLELARALATDPTLLLLDEVMAGLNTAEIDETIEMIKKLRESGITLIVVEHVMKAVMGMSDKIMVLNVGQKIAEGTPEEVSNNEQVIKVYLGEQ